MLQEKRDANVWMALGGVYLEHHKATRSTNNRLYLKTHTRRPTTTAPRAQAPDAATAYREAGKLRKGSVSATLGEAAALDAMGKVGEGRPPRRLPRRQGPQTTRRRRAREGPRSAASGRKADRRPRVRPAAPSEAGGPE